LAVTIILARPLFAAPDEDSQKKPVSNPASERIERIVGGLTLSDDQKARLAEVEKQFGPQLTEVMKRLGELDRQLRQNVISVLTAEQKQQVRNKAAGQKKGEKGVPVTGQVIFQGQPVAKAHIAFQPVGKGDAGTMTTDDAGKFVGSLKVGQYRVAMRLIVEGRSVLPAKYGSPETSGLTMSVTSGANRFDFSLQ
jgi:hypothetical protein